MRLTLRQKQSKFARMLAILIQEFTMRGYEITLGEAYRSPQEAERLAKLGKGISNSLHTSRLAIDINLFKNGRHLSSTEAHREIGEWWERQGGSWGGRFSRQDGGHYSLEHNGVK